ncbi:MAG: acyl-CoA dehydrogenase [Deferribacterales bacterium]|jgi:alkylation response protein AidB-like acyl-CoA dehydrogenase
MDFTLTEEQQLLLDSLKELVEQEGPELYWKECDREEKQPVEFIKSLIDNGFGLLGVPEEHGGVPVDYMTQILVAEHLCKFGAPHNLLSSPLQIKDILSFGNEEQIAQTMEVVKDGRLAFSLGITEPQAGSDTNRIAATFTRKDGKVYINGNKTFITEGDRCPYMMCMTRDFDVEDMSKAFTMWWIDVEKHKDNIKFEKLDKVGWKMNHTCEVYLENVELDESDMLGKEGHGFMQLMENFEIERLIMAAYILGMAECAFKDAATYVNQRVQFGKPIAKQQITQLKIAEMYTKIENMRNMVYRCAWDMDQGNSVQISSAMCKLYCAQAGNEVIDQALQLHGGIGYTNDTRVSRLWRDARVFRIGGGTDEIMVHIMGRAILKKYTD